LFAPACWGLDRHGLRESRQEGLHRRENASAERINGILKQEYGLGISLRSKKQALRAINEAAFLYNTRHPYLALNFETPEKTHGKIA
jgi:transposase InsO family protein